jgi:glycolate oxidase FAD binding subunit
MNDGDFTEALQERVRDAIDQQSPLSIVGGGSKAFYGRSPRGDRIEVSGHRGIVSYEPTELVMTARAGTPLQEIEQVLADHGQMLPFEPPHFGTTATLGGTVACNLSGPRRPYAGAARDFVLGTRIINGKGEVQRFGGEVMKNVAGYDVSRLMCGALGTLGILLEISLKVLPRPQAETTLVQRRSEQDAIQAMHDLGRKPLPVSGTLYDGDALFVRLSGTPKAVSAARDDVGGDEVPDGASLWSDVREHRHPFFSGQRPLWRLSLASTMAPLDLDGRWLLEWGGAQRWVTGDFSEREARQVAEAHGGHATLYRGDGDEAVFHPLPDALMNVHRRIKEAFDPNGTFNPGRMYPDL